MSDISVISQETVVSVTAEDTQIVVTTIQEQEIDISANETVMELQLVEDTNLATIDVENPLKAIIIEATEQGPPGRDGIDGIDSDKTYIHVQIAALSEWNIPHLLDKYPSVSVVDSGNTEVVGDVDYIDSNNVVVRFTAPFGGRAYLN